MGGRAVENMQRLSYQCIRGFGPVCEPFLVLKVSEFSLTQRHMLQTVPGGQQGDILRPHDIVFPS